MVVIARILFATVIMFELLGGFDIVHMPLDFSWFGLIATAAVSWLVVEVLFRGGVRRVDLAVALMATLIVIVLDVGGDVLHLYSRIVWYDQLLHLIGGGVVAYLAYIVIARYDEIKGTALKGLFVVGMASLFGAIYEIEEWLEDVWVHGTVLRLGDGPDTADDMMMNIIGAGVVAATIAIYETRKKKHER